MRFENLVANDPHFSDRIGLYNQMHPVVNSPLSTLMQGEKNYCNKNLKLSRSEHFEIFRRRSKAFSKKCSLSF